MKAKFATGFITAALLLLAGCLRSSAQSYSIDWHKIAGGGGASAGGTFSLSGTIGQHDASAPTTGGTSSLLGGFWALYSVPTPGAPTLSIKLTSTNTAMVYWPSPSTGWIIQTAVNASSTNWAPPVETVTDNGTVKYIIINQPLGNRFFRLKNP